MLTTFMGFPLNGAGFPPFVDDFWSWPTHIKSKDKTRTDKGLEILLEMPGLNKEDVKVEVKDGWLTISSTKNHIKEEKDKYFSREWYSKSFVKSYPLEGLNEDNVEASLKDGVLKVFVPKLVNTKVIEIL